jgi:hypothetical protein
MDPHLGCPKTIYMYGSHMADASGRYTINGWPPSGSKKVDYSGTWSYSGSGTQLIATIDVHTLLSQAAANGDTPAHQGYHFKLDLSQDPQKHKTFWINCGSSSSSTTGSLAGTTTKCQGSNRTSEENESSERGEHKGRGKHHNHGKHKGELKHHESNESAEENESSEENESKTCSSPSGASPTTGSNTSPASAGSSPTTTSSTSPASATAPTTATTAPSTGSSTPRHSVKAAHAKRKRHRKLVKPRRHRRAKKRSVSAASVSAPTFTG